MNVNEYLQTLGAVSVEREIRYAVPVPPSCSGRVVVVVAEPEGLDSYARVSWSPDGKAWYWHSPVMATDVDTIRRQIADAIAELMPNSVRVTPNEGDKEGDGFRVVGYAGE